jgi:hypothetical protein
MRCFSRTARTAGGRRCREARTPSPMAMWVAGPQARASDGVSSTQPRAQRSETSRCGIRGRSGGGRVMTGKAAGPEVSVRNRLPTPGVDRACAQPGAAGPAGSAGPRGDRGRWRPPERAALPAPATVDGRDLETSSTCSRSAPAKAEPREARERRRARRRRGFRSEDWSARATAAPPRAPRSSAAENSAESRVTGSGLLG